MPQMTKGHFEDIAKAFGLGAAQAAKDLGLAPEVLAVLVRPIALELAKVCAANAKSPFTLYRFTHEIRCYFRQMLPLDSLTPETPNYNLKHQLELIHLDAETVPTPENIGRALATYLEEDNIDAIREALAKAVVVEPVEPEANAQGELTPLPAADDVLHRPWTHSQVRDKWPGIYWIEGQGPGPKGPLTPTDIANPNVTYHASDAKEPSHHPAFLYLAGPGNKPTHTYMHGWWMPLVKEGVPPPVGEPDAAVAVALMIKAQTVPGADKHGYSHSTVAHHWGHTMVYKGPLANSFYYAMQLKESDLLEDISLLYTNGKDNLPTHRWTSNSIGALMWQPVTP